MPNVNKIQVGDTAYDIEDAVARAGKADISTGNTTPTVATVGNVGSFYFNLVTKKLYKCLGTNPASVLTVTNGTESGNFRFRFNTTVRQLMADAGMTITVSFPAQLEGELAWNYWFLKPNYSFAYVHRTEASQSFNYQKLVRLSSDGTMSGTISYHWVVDGASFNSREDSYSGSSTSANYGNGEGFYLNGSNPEPVYIYSSSGTYIGDIASAKFTPNDVGISMGFVEQEYSVQYIWEEVVLADALTAYRTASAQDVIDNGKLDANLKGAAGGIAELDANGKVPSAQLPSYVDDVLEYATKDAFPATGETGKIYIAQDTNKTFRWSGTAYVEISASLALGETSSTAYRGDRGKAAYDHSQDANVHVTAAQKAAWVKHSDLNASTPMPDTETLTHINDNDNGVRYEIPQGTYSKPGTGIPETDLAQAVKNRLHTVSIDPDDHVDSIDTKQIASTYDATGRAIIDTYATKTELGNKVDKVSGKGLSTNDYTTTEKNKLSGIADGAEVNVNADWNATSGDAQILNKPTIPTVPTVVSAFENDANYLTLATLPRYQGGVS